LPGGAGKLPSIAKRFRREKEMASDTVAAPGSAAPGVAVPGVAVLSSRKEDEICLRVESRYPILYITTWEEYRALWSLRTVAHRIQTAQNTPSTQFLVQLDLHGLSSIGTNPLAVLQRRIPGYAVGPVATDPALAEW